MYLAYVMSLIHRKDTSVVQELRHQARNLRDCEFCLRHKTSRVTLSQSLFFSHRNKAKANHLKKKTLAKKTVETPGNHKASRLTQRQEREERRGKVKVTLWWLSGNP